MGCSSKGIIGFENFNKARLLGIVLRTAKTLSNLMLFLMIHENKRNFEKPPPALKSNSTNKNRKT